VDQHVGRRCAEECGELALHVLHRARLVDHAPGLVAEVEGEDGAGPRIAHEQHALGPEGERAHRADLGLALHEGRGGLCGRPWR
jgi:hypothetical protein